KMPRLEVEGFAVVDVDGSLGGEIIVERDDEGVRIMFHQRGRFARAVFAGEDIAAAHEHRGMAEQGGVEADGGALCRVGFVGEVVIVDVRCGGEVHVDAFHVFFQGGFDEEACVSDVELVVEREAGFVRGVHVPHWSDDGFAGRGGRVEGCGLRDGFRVRCSGEIGFAAAGIDVRVGAEERVEGAGLIPPRQELLARVPEEPADVGAGEGEARDGLVEDHGDGSFEVVPGGKVVARPHGAHALGSCVEGAGENEGATLVFWVVTREQGFVGRVDESETVDVVHVAVLPAAEMEVVLRHRRFWAVEHGGLVHVVPEESVRSDALEAGVGEKRFPPLDNSRVEGVGPVGGTGPAPALEDVVVLIDDGKILSLQCIHYRVVGFVLDVRIHDDDKFAAIVSEMFLHAKGVGKVVFVPGEIFLAFGILNVEPDDVVRDSVLVEFAVDVFDILVSHVIPSALVIAESEVLGELGIASELVVRLDDVFRGWAKEYKNIQEPVLGKPVRMRIRSPADPKTQGIAGPFGLHNIHPCFCGIEPEDPSSRILSMSLHQRNGTPDTLGASRFRVSVATKTFFPPGVFVFGGFRGFGFSLLLHSVDFWPPMLHVQQSFTIELDLSILATHEVNREWRMLDDSFEVVIRARGLVGDIISKFEKRGYKLAAIKMVTPSKEHLEEHYKDLSEKPFFKGLVTYMLSGPIVAMVWEGRDAVKTGRTLLGATNPLQSAPGTIRGDYAIDVGRNVCHGSDSVETAKNEIDLWFGKGEVIDYKSAQFDWIYEKP
ncbi:MAG: hypothetical protein Q9194_004379, partial [Teloschistes cf. exilis]